MNEREMFFATSMHVENRDGPLRGAARMKLPFRPTPEHPMIISTSEIGSFLRCRLQWNWSRRVGLKFTGIGKEQGIGILVHEMREQWYLLKPKERTVKAMKRVVLKVLTKSDLAFADQGVRNEARALASAMSIGYADWALSDHDQNDAAIGLRDARASTEELFVIPLNKKRTVFLRGKVDLRFEPTHLKHTMAVEEAKTRAGISFDMLDLNSQLSAYLAAMRIKYPKFKRYIAYRDVLRRQMPGPRVKAALYGRSDPIERSDEEIELWLKDTRRQVADMLDAAIYPNQTDSCRWDCDFYKLCVLRSGATSKQDQEDFDSVLETEYTRKDPLHSQLLASAHHKLRAQKVKG